MAEALAIVETQRDAEGRWPLQNVFPGDTHLVMEAGEVTPSRWNTLRAMRVLRWAGDEVARTGSGEGGRTWTRDEINDQSAGR
jgi:hypothetical protein